MYLSIVIRICWLCVYFCNSCVIFYHVPTRAMNRRFAVSLCTWWFLFCVKYSHWLLTVENTTACWLFFNWRAASDCLWTHSYSFRSEWIKVDLNILPVFSFSEKPPVSNELFQGSDLTVWILWELLSSINMKFILWHCYNSE